MIGVLAWAPPAAAETASPSRTPSSGTAPRVTSDAAPAIGGIRIIKKDPGGALLPGASFTLVDSTGTQAGTGTTDAAGRLDFQELGPGVYRLKETSSGSPLHEVVADQDVIVPPGVTVPLTIVDPFKPAGLTVKKTDRTTGKPLAGAVINITPHGGGRAFTLTTGKDGTAKTTLPVTVRAGTPYTATETRAPAGYLLNPKPVRITAKPGAPVTLNHAGVKMTAPTPPPVEPPQATPPAVGPPTTTKPSPNASVGGTAAPKTPMKPGTPPSSAPAVTASEAADSTPADQTEEKGELARTGAAAPWLLGGTGLLLAAGAGAVIAARRRTDGENHTAGDTGQD
ncbi:SpaA isopeptide-forming pilin-related protein [Streptomyces uncialis]|uniref:MSCRAMM family protein n=1 Tax=Streptomyces uncialis TaxID=1048205 RepID=UPI0037F571EF